MASCVPEEVCLVGQCSNSQTDCSATNLCAGDDREGVLMGSGSFLSQTTNKIQSPEPDSQHQKMNEYLFVKYKSYL